MAARRLQSMRDKLPFPWVLENRGRAVPAGGYNVDGAVVVVVRSNRRGAGGGRRDAGAFGYIYKCTVSVIAPHPVARKSVVVEDRVSLWSGLRLLRIAYKRSFVLLSVYNS